MDEYGMVPYLIVSRAADAIDFYRRAFDAEETMRLDAPGGLIGHAEVRIGGAPVFLADETQDMVDGPVRSPASLGATTVLLHRYVPDVDAVVEQARAAGGTVVREPEDQFYGDRAAVVQDPWGHQWSIHTRIREMSVEEIEAAMPDAS